MTDPAGLVALQLEVVHIAELRDWEPVGALLEVVAGAVHGTDALGDREIRQLRQWAERWRALPVSLRIFYARHAPTDTTASVALWKILHGSRARLEGWQYGRLQRLWQEQYGYDPWFELVPRPVVP